MHLTNLLYSLSAWDDLFEVLCKRKLTLPLYSTVFNYVNKIIKLQIESFVSMQCVIDLDTQEATDDLQPQVIKMLKEKFGCNCTTVSQILDTEDKVVFKAIQDGIDRYNTHLLISNAQKVQDLIITLS